MTVLLAILVSGVLLNTNDKPMPQYQLAFTSADGKVIKVITDKEGKFQVDLEPGTYRYQFGLITVGQKTCGVVLKARPEPPKTPEPCIEIIRGSQRAGYSPRHSQQFRQ
jgi:hypothetical protein